MSNTTNITNSCWGLPARKPDAWTTTQISDPFYNTTGCAVPVCESNPAILAACSNTTIENLNLFNGTGNATYLSYTLPRDTDAATYQAYQNCLLNNNAVRYLCAIPYHSTNGCPGSWTITAPSLAYPQDGNKYQICTIPNSVNSSRIMSSCCDDLQSDQGGCQVSCYKKYVNGTTLAQCLARAYRREDTSLGYVCHPSDTDLQKSTSSGASSSLRFTGSSGTIWTLVCALSLMAVLL